MAQTYQITAHGTDMGDHVGATRDDMTTAYSCRIEVRHEGQWVPAPGESRGWGVVEALDAARVGEPGFAPHDVRVVQERTGLVVTDGVYDALPSICKRAIIAIGGAEFDAIDAVFCIEALGSLGDRRTLAKHLFMSAATRAQIPMDPITLNPSPTSARRAAWNAACDYWLLPLGEQD